MKHARVLVAECIGSAFLLMVVVGSGILADKLNGGANLALSVLCVAFATGGVLYALITSLGAVSAHFNPAVTLVSAFRRELSWSLVLPYIVSQILGACLGVIMANLMFDLPAVTISQTARHASGQYLGEFIAIFGLLGTIFGTARHRPEAVPAAVAAYVAGAIYFTSSTCFANPAVTTARTLTGTLTGICPADVAAYVAFQVLGALSAMVVFGWLFKAEDGEIEKIRRELTEEELRLRLERDYKLHNL